MSKLTTIHERLIAARTEAGYETASDAARAYGWNENTYRSHENGERGIKSIVAEKYSRAFNVSLAYILTGEGYKYLPYSNEHIPIRGYVIEDFKVKMVAKDRDGIFLGSNFTMANAEHIAEIGFEMPFNAAAFEASNICNAVSFGPGDLIVVEDEPFELNKVAGQLCFIEIGNNQLLVQIVAKADEDGNIFVQTNTRTPPRIVTPTYLAPVALIIPYGRWNRFTREEFGAEYPESYREGS